MLSESTPKNTSRSLMMIILIIVILVAAAVLFVLFNRIANQPANGVNTGAAIVDSASVFTGGTPIDPPREMNDFTLTDNDGGPISLSDLRGKVTLLYFGYTHCPDFCPTTMANYKRVKEMLGESADQVAFVMVSIDGTRDTPGEMKKYLGNFDPAFIGMTGSESDVEGIAIDYNVTAETQSGGSTDEYNVDHTPSLYMIDLQGRLVMEYMYGTEPDVITEDIQKLLGS
jgi:protein SCO1